MSATSQPGEGGAAAAGVIVAYVPDLMDRSKVAKAAPGTQFVASADALVTSAVGARLVVVDLARPGALDAVTAINAMGVATVGFASHVNHPLMTSAKEAGCARVLARSAFFARLRDLLSA
jgi:hypothetical protein